MQLKTKDLRQFLSLSNPVSTNNVIPILAYIKLENGYLTKTNLNTYVLHKITAPAEERLLLDEKVLSAFLKDCRSEQIEVKLEDKSVWLIEGKRKMRYQSADIKDFPKLPDAEKESAVDFDADVLSALGVAAKSTGGTGIGSPFDYVHIKDDYIVASDNHKFYTRKVEGLPHLILTTETCNIISQFQNATFYQRAKYNFFEIGNTLYGFIQTESKTPNFGKLIPKSQPAEYIDFEASEFIAFCEAVLSASPSKDLSAQFLENKLIFVNSEIDFEYEIELKTDGDFKPNFYFMPKMFSSYFKSLGISTIRLCDSGFNNSSYSIWDLDDRFFAGILAGALPNS